MTLDQIKDYLKQLKEIELEEIKAQKVSHHKFSHILLACTLLTTDLTPAMKNAVMQGAREQLA